MGLNPSELVLSTVPTPLKPLNSVPIHVKLSPYLIDRQYTQVEPQLYTRFAHNQRQVDSVKVPRHIEFN